MAGLENTPALAALLIAPDRELAERLAAAVGQAQAFRIVEEWPAYPELEALESRLAAVRPEVVLLDVSTDFGRAAELIGRLKGAKPPVPVVGVHARSGGEAVLGSLRAGASEFLHGPFDPLVQQQAAARIRRLIEPLERPGAARVLAFLGAKAGAGVSTLALQTAFALARRGKGKVLLADMDLMSADLAGGVDPGSPGLDLARVSAAAELGPLVERARRRYAWTVLDLPPVFHRASVASLPLADALYLVTTAELASLHLSQRAVGLLAQLGYERGRVEVLVNRVQKRRGVSGADLTMILGPPVKRSFPEDRLAVEQAQAAGAPLAAGSELGRVVEEFAAELASIRPAQASRAGR